ncbi:MAG: MFS transporter [Alphaproteobacteria bacterium]|nr:MFS transporter [Alphaproteobacteria bacterium]
MAGTTRLTFTERLFFGGGAIGNGFVVSGVTTLLLLFYNQAVGMSPEWVGLALMISIILDAFWDPVIGYWTDHFRSRFGRRHPFMYASAIPTALCFYLLFTPPLTWSDEGKFVYLLLTVMSVRFFISVYEISSTALVPEVAPDYDDRTAVLGYRFFFGTMGGFAFLWLGFSVFLPEAGGPQAPGGYGPLAAVSAIVIVVTLALSASGTHKRIGELRAPEQEELSLAEVWRNSRSILTNRTFLIILISGLSSGLGAGLTSSLGVYFNAYFWEQTSGSMGFLASSAILAGFVGVVLAPPVSKRFGKKNAMLGLAWISLGASIIPVTLRLLGLMPPNSSPVVFWILFIDNLVAGVLALMAVVIIVSLLSDIVEQIAAETGRRNEGLLFAFNGLLQKVVTGVGTFGAGLMLAFVGFPEQAIPGQIDPDIPRNLVLLWLPIAVSLSVITLVVLHFLDVSRARHEANLAKIDAAAIPGDLTGTLLTSGVRSAPEGELRL